VLVQLDVVTLQRPLTQSTPYAPGFGSTQAGHSSGSSPHSSLNNSDSFFAFSATYVPEQLGQQPVPARNWQSEAEEQAVMSVVRKSTTAQCPAAQVGT
jgi:hypothetical protein